MLSGHVEPRDDKLLFTLETDSVLELIAVMRAWETREKLSRLITTIDLERPQHERSQDVNDAMLSASEILHFEELEAM